MHHTVSIKNWDFLRERLLDIYNNKQQADEPYGGSFEYFVEKCFVDVISWNCYLCPDYNLKLILDEELALDLLDAIDVLDDKDINDGECCITDVIFNPNINALTLCYEFSYLPKDVHMVSLKQHRRNINRVKKIHLTTIARLLNELCKSNSRQHS